jgi:hypothetical protein
MLTASELLYNQKHNEEAQQVWDAFNAGMIIRPPVYLAIAIQYFIKEEAGRYRWAA